MKVHGVIIDLEYLDKLLNTENLINNDMTDDELLQAEKLTGFRKCRINEIFANIDDAMNMLIPTSEYHFILPGTGQIVDPYASLRVKHGINFSKSMFNSRSIEVWKEIIDFTDENKIAKKSNCNKARLLLSYRVRIDDVLQAQYRLEQMEYAKAKETYELRMQEENAKAPKSFEHIDIKIPGRTWRLSNEEHDYNVKKLKAWMLKAKLVDMNIEAYGVSNDFIDELIPSKCGVSLTSCNTLSNEILEDEKLRLPPVEKLNSYMMDENNLITNFIMPETVRVVGVKAFSNCKNLKSVKFGVNVKEIEGGAFYGCSSLENIELPDNLEVISGSAFDRSLWLKNYFKEHNELIYKDIFVKAANKDGITIPSYINDISESAFRNCTRLTSIDIPSNIAYIPNSCFRGCHNLSKIDLGKVEFIGAYAFYMCKGLRDIDIPEGVISIQPHTFENCYSLDPSKIKFPSTLKIICTSAFAGLQYKTFRVPPTVKVIADNAFFESYVEKVYLPKDCIICKGSDQDNTLSRDWDTKWNPEEIVIPQRFNSGNGTNIEIEYY